MSVCMHMYALLLIAPPIPWSCLSSFVTLNPSCPDWHYILRGRRGILWTCLHLILALRAIRLMQLDGQPWYSHILSRNRGEEKKSCLIRFIVTFFISTNTQSLPKQWDVCSTLISLQSQGLRRAEHSETRQKNNISEIIRWRDYAVWVSWSMLGVSVFWWGELCNPPTYCISILVQTNSHTSIKSSPLSRHPFARQDRRNPTPFLISRSYLPSFCFLLSTTAIY